MHQQKTENDAFFHQLQDIIDNIPNHDVKLLTGDMNANIDNKDIVWIMWSHHRAECWQIKENGQWLLMFCNMNSLCIGNTYYVQNFP